MENAALRAMLKVIYFLRISLGRHARTLPYEKWIKFLTTEKHKINANINFLNNTNSKVYECSFINYNNSVLSYVHKFSLTSFRFHISQPFYNFPQRIFIAAF